MHNTWMVFKENLLNSKQCRKVEKKILHFIYSLCGIWRFWEKECTTSFLWHTEPDKKICDYLLDRSNIRGEKNPLLILCKSFPQGLRSGAFEFETLCCMGWLFLHISAPQYPALFGKWFLVINNSSVRCSLAPFFLQGLLILSTLSYVHLWA